MNKRIRVSIIMAVIAAVFVVAALILNLVRTGLKEELPEQEAVNKWSIDENYSLISCYFSSKASMSKEQAFYLRESIDRQLVSDSMASTEEVSKMWTYAYSAEETLSVTKGNATALTNGILFSGDFFYIHDYEFVYGWHLEDDGTSLNFAVIDEVLAWQLFGSSNVCGMEMYINDSPYTVCGVLKQNYDKEWSELYGEKPRVFILYESEGVKDMYSEVDTLELILPNPISNYGMKLAENVLSSYLNTADLIENSERLSLLSLLKKIPKLSSLGVRQKETAYPYWENYAILIEVKSAYVVLFEAIFAVIALICAITAVAAIIRPCASWIEGILVKKFKIRRRKRY